MDNTEQLLKDLSSRTNGDCYLGIVGPVRVGKSTFIRRFMELCVLDHIENPEEKGRTIDELPSTGEGKTILTSEVKFVPSNAVCINLDDIKINIRLIDCIGYIIESSSGYMEDGKMRLVQTPWFNEPIPFDEAARIGTEKVIKDHSTLGIVILSDGSTSSFASMDYAKAEDDLLNTMKALDKPFVIVLNSAMVNSKEAKAKKEYLEEKYRVSVIIVNIKLMTKEEANLILKAALYQFPINGIELLLPSWIKALNEDHYIKKSLQDSIEYAMDEARIVYDVDKISSLLEKNEYVEKAILKDVNMAQGICKVQIDVKEELYEKILKELVGCEINNRGELIRVLSEYVKAKESCDFILSALEEARQVNYGFASSKVDNYQIEKPTLTKQGSRYGVKLKAKSACYHIIKVDVDTSFEPVLGSKEQAEFFLNYLLEAYEKNELDVLNCELFGRKFKDILVQGIETKLNSLPEHTKQKLIMILKTISNKSKSSLIAFVF